MNLNPAGLHCSYLFGALAEDHTRQRSATCASIPIVSCELVQLESSQIRVGHAGGGGWLGFMAYQPLLVI